MKPKGKIFRVTHKRDHILIERKTAQPKAPSYTTILKSIAKVKTVRQLDKAQELVINYAGAPYKVTRLYEVYNVKNRRVRNINRLK